MTLLKLSDNLKSSFVNSFKPLVEQMVSEGKIENPNTNGAYSNEAKSIKDTHRKTILDNGRADFSKAYAKLSENDKINLYCYYYFQMHFTSSYVLYLKSIDKLKTSAKGKEICFIDVGCGPYTSGFAFELIMNKFDKLNCTRANYIGIDISSNMITKAKVVADQLSNQMFSSKLFNIDKDFITDGLHLMVEDYGNVLYIVNYSYLFASKTLDVSDFQSFTNSIYTQQCMDNNSDLLILHQNPNYSILNEKWNEYKIAFDYLQTSSDFPKVISFSFNDVLESCKYVQPKFKVYCDILEMKNL